MASTVENDLYDHRDALTPILREICVNCVGVNNEVGEFVNSDYCDRKSSAFVIFLKDCYTPDERRLMMQRLMRCKCCSRHSHYKDLKYKPDDAVPESKDKGCQCNCRHYARLFKRNNLA